MFNDCMYINLFLVANCFNFSAYFLLNGLTMNERKWHKSRNFKYHLNTVNFFNLLLHPVEIIIIYEEYGECNLI